MAANGQAKCLSSQVYAGSHDELGSVGALPSRTTTITAAPPTASRVRGDPFRQLYARTIPVGCEPLVVIGLASRRLVRIAKACVSEPWLHGLHSPTLNTMHPSASACMSNCCTTVIPFTVKIAQKNPVRGHCIAFRAPRWALGPMNGQRQGTLN